MPDSLLPLTLLTLAIILALVFWPRKGIYFRFRLFRERAHRMRIEDALKQLQSAAAEGRASTLQSLSGALNIPTNRTVKLLQELQQSNFISHKNGTIALTPAGEQAATHIMRVHRLWESYLAEKTGYAASEWHAQAEKKEHSLSVEEADLLSSELGFPKFDPHGDPIPSKHGRFEQPESQPLLALEPKQWARIVHIEDEPQSIADQIRAEELEPGMLIQQREKSSHRIIFRAAGQDHVLAPIVAANIQVWPLPKEALAEIRSFERLPDIQPGESAEVIQIAPGCRGAERRRLLDLGILPGTKITAELDSPSGDPTAYRIRGAVIALREEQAKFIQINRLAESTT